MIFKSSYVLTESNGYLRRDPLVGPRQVAVLATAMIVSVMLGVGAFAVFTGMHRTESRVTWVLQPPKIVKTIARSVVPAMLQAAGEVGRGS